MTLSNQSHFPGFFLSLESHLIGFCKSYKMASANPACHISAPGPDQFRRHQIAEDDKPESARPRKVIFCDLVMPESHLGKPEKMI
jgi:hypothetical protein